MSSSRRVPLELALRTESAELRARPAPAGLHAAVLSRCQPREDEPARPLGARRLWPRLAAAALVLVLAGWGHQAWQQRRQALIAPMPVRVLRQVTAEPMSTARRLGEATFMRRLGDDVQVGLSRAGARTTLAARELAGRLAGPLRALSRLL